MIKPKKSLGQNFLTDKNVLKKIVDKIEIENKNVFEIGGGTGNLTEYLLLKRPKKLIVIEKDKNLFKSLVKKFQAYEKVIIINEDILKFNIEKKLEKNSIIFGNLPYNISTKIITNLVKFKNWPPKYEKLILMFQKEVADRIVSESGSPNFGRLSILCGARLSILSKFFVSKNCFYPKPKVDSSVLIFEPSNSQFLSFNEIIKLEKITNALFSSRRKMISKKFNKIFKNVNLIYRNLNLKPSLRPENIEKESYYKLIKYLN